MTPEPTSLRLCPITTRLDEQGRLWLGGCLARDLAAEFGTPLYVLDEATLTARCREAQEAFAGYEGGVRVAYAAKAFLCVGLAQLLARQGMGLDVVSAGEMAVARAAGFPPGWVHLHGNNKSPAELAAALDWGLGRVVVDGWHELQSLRQLAAERPGRQRVWLRVAPGIDVHTHNHRKTGLLDSKFGFTVATGEAAEALRQALAAPELEVVGLHAHVGSQVFEPEPFARTAEVLLDLAAEAGYVPQEISPGGGWGSATDPAQADLPLRTYGEAISAAVRERCRRHGLPLPRIAVELGRAIIGPAGVALYTVGGRKEIPGVRTCVALDGGMGDNIRPALYGARYAALTADGQDRPLEMVTLVGRYCESGDVLVRDVRLPGPRAGDLVAIPRAGAYALPMASNYNLVPRPAVVLVGNGRARLLQRRETVEDLLRRDVPLSDA